jgi:DNA-binding CsgD family transcriptional regulator
METPINKENVRRKKAKMNRNIGILELLASGYNAREIGELLDITPGRARVLVKEAKKDESARTEIVRGAMRFY